MNKKVVANWVSLAMVLSFIVIITEIAPNVEAPITWFVDDVPGGGGPGDPLEDFTSIQDAINASSDGDTVYVYNGTYYEHVIVNKTINLTGEDRDNTIIDGNGVGDTIIITVNWVNVTGFTVMGGGSNMEDSGLQIDSDFNFIYGNNFSSNKYNGVFLYYSWNNHVKNNYFSNNSMYGILALHSDYNEITFNMVTLNKVGGIVISNSDRNNIRYNNALNTDFGVEIVYSNWNNVTDNVLQSNDFDGIFTLSASENNITNNNASLNKRYGIWPRESTYNYITGNTLFSNNKYGIYMLDSLNNHIYHNNIIDNKDQAYDNQAGNYWDNGYPSGGNYWSDYNGIDLNSTPTQNVPPPDGIGDSPYVIDANSWDNYPLMIPFTPLPLDNYTILKQGWNLISIPLIQKDQNLTKVLENINGKYDAVQCYDITDINDPWEHYKVGKTWGNDLTKINETIGFWIHITSPGNTIFQYNGTQPIQNQNITLHPGWNLVGYPSVTDYNRTDGLNNIYFPYEVDSIWTYKAVTQKWKELGPSDYFEPCMGYWIHANVKCIWEVPL